MLNWPILTCISDDLYITVDKSYGEMENGFVIAQSLVNIVEVLFLIIGLMKRKSLDGFLLILFASVMSCSKTVLYMLVDACEGFKFTNHNDMQTFITLYFLPSFAWILFPGLVWIWGWGQLKSRFQTNKDK